ncbi:MAG: glycosyltransferase family 39 protein [Acidobacteria bacterium]|nr:glycosyltransferase family 39 protein [Acidobacteriota bacterium]
MFASAAPGSRHSGPTIVTLSVILFVVLFWRLGDASFWDPDEAHYAQTTVELIQRGDWMAPFYNGAPFFDKPILFYWFQAIPMSLVPDPETAARLAPAVAGVLLVGVTAWFGFQLFGQAVGLTAALLLATNAGVFALARYAILDLPFTLFLFGGVAAITVAMLQQRRGLEYGGYLLVGLANATKGPIALVLCGVAFVLVCAVSAEARRRLLALRWVQGAVIALLPGLPWPAYMLWRFGWDFVNGYVLNENIKLFATPMYAGQPGWHFYLWIVLLGMLPWTGMLLARAYETVRGYLAPPAEEGRPASERRPDLVDILLWCWVVGIVAFFSFSRFKLDHYVFPASPALCLIAARAWHDARAGRADRATWLGIRLIGPTLVVAGGVIAYAAAVLLDLPRGFFIVPAALVTAGAITAWRTRPGGHLPTWPVAPVIAMLVVYVGALAWVMPRLEEGKAVPHVARWVAEHASSGQRVAAFRLNRWNTAYRFYVGRPVTVIESDDDARAFFSDPSPYYVVMTHELYEALRAAGVPLQIAYEREGRWVTSGKALWKRGGERTRFVVAAPAAAGTHP